MLCPNGQFIFGRVNEKIARNKNVLESSFTSIYKIVGPIIKRYIKTHMVPFNRN